MVNNIQLSDLWAGNDDDVELFVAILASFINKMLQSGYFYRSPRSLNWF